MAKYNLKYITLQRNIGKQDTAIFKNKYFTVVVSTKKLLIFHKASRLNRMRLI